MSRLRQTALLALKLGLTAFGGPAAHIAMLHDEAVTRRGWLDDQEFLDLLGATNLIPGPNSTEMVIHVSYRRAGWPGLVVGGACFILPAMLSVLALAWAYVRYGATPAAAWLLYGIKPVIIAVVVQALWLLGRKAVAGLLTAAVAAGVLALYFAGVNELLLLAAGGLLVTLVQNRRRLPGWGALPALLDPPAGAAIGAAAAATATIATFSLSTLFLTFLKIGAVLYGSGYVLLAFLQRDLVTRLGWLTEQQLVDAIAVGQLTPGPVFTTATFVGYVLGGLPAALLATLGIFLPAFFFVGVSTWFVPRLRRSPWVGGALDGVNAAALGLMAAVTWQLAQAAVVDPLTAGLALAAAVLLFRFGANTTWLIAGGALAGLLSSWGNSF